jgi:hypothetical protein
MPGGDAHDSALSMAFCVERHGNPELPSGIIYSTMLYDGCVKDGLASS